MQLVRGLRPSIIIVFVFFNQQFGKKANLLIHLVGAEV